MHAPEDILISIRVRAGASVDTVRALTGADPAGVEIKEIRAVDRTDGASVHDVLVCGAAERVSAFGDAITGLEGIEILDRRDVVFEAHRDGKIEVTSRAPLRGLSDLEIIYTPGVARVVSAIHQAPALAWDYTGMGNTVGI